MGGHIARRRSDPGAQVHPRPKQCDTHHGCSGQKRPEPPLAGERRNEYRRGRSRGGPLGEEHDFPAAGTLGKMRQTLGALVFRQHAFDEGAERICVGMNSGM